MKSLFVTSTGTDIGKTFICCRLLETLGGSIPVRCIKPVISGFDPEQPGVSDTAKLLKAQRLPVTDANIEATSPWRFRASLSADMAARRENRQLNLNEIVRFSQAPDSVGLNLIEGVGGVMAPLNERHTVLDWISALETEVLLVVGSYLGSLSHTLTALEALASRSLVPAAIVVSQSEHEPVSADESIETLQRFTGAMPYISMPRSEKASATDLVALLKNGIL